MGTKFVSYGWTDASVPYLTDAGVNKQVITRVGIPPGATRADMEALITGIGAELYTPAAQPVACIDESGVKNFDPRYLAAHYRGANGKNRKLQFVIPFNEPGDIYSYGSQIKNFVEGTLNGTVGCIKLEGEYFTNIWYLDYLTAPVGNLVTAGYFGGNVSINYDYEMETPGAGAGAAGTTTIVKKATFDSHAENVLPTELATLINGCTNPINSQGCANPLNVSPRHFRVTTAYDNGGVITPQKTTIPCGDFDVGTCLTDIRANNFIQCVSYKGESSSFLHRYLP